MKALLLKEFYMAKSYMRVFAAMVLIFLFASVWANGNMFLIMYPMIITSMLPMSLLSYDEKFHWDRYCAAMPFTRSQVVSAKYVFVLLSALAILLVSAVAQGIRLLPEGKEAFFCWPWAFPGLPSCCPSSTSWAVSGPASPITSSSARSAPWPLSCPMTA